MREDVTYVTSSLIGYGIAKHDLGCTKKSGRDIIGPWAATVSVYSDLYSITKSKWPCLFCMLILSDEF